MAHGYIGDGYGIDGGVNSDRDEDRDRDRRDREWRARGEDWRDRDRGMMFGERGSERWSHDDRWPQDRWPEQRGRADTYNRQSEDWSGQRRFSAHPDDHYRSWRERHMSELDRDYQDYCREREQQFHQEFDAWRRQRHASYQPLRTGMTNSGMSHDPSGELQLTDEANINESGADPMAAATLGTNSSESSGIGRRRR